MDTLGSIGIMGLEIILTTRLLMQGFYKSSHYIMLMMAAIFIIILIQIGGWSYESTPQVFYIVDLFLVGSLYTMWRSANNEMKKRKKTKLDELNELLVDIKKPGTNKSSNVYGELQRSIKARQHKQWRYEIKPSQTAKMILTCVIFICMCCLMSGVYKLLTVGSISVGHCLFLIVSGAVLTLCRPNKKK